MLLIAFFAPWAANAQEQTLTVCDDTEYNSQIPVYGMYADKQGATSEYIIPSTTEGMNVLAGGSISKLTFYLASPAVAAWTSTFQVYMAEVDNTTLSGVVGPDACIVVYTGTLDATGSTMEIELDTPFFYGGGNLLIGTYIQTATNVYKSAYFYGVSATGAGYHHHGSTNSAQDFMAKTTFTYISGSAPTCERPTNLQHTGSTATTATLR